MPFSSCVDDCAIPVGSERFEIAYGLATDTGLHFLPLAHVTFVIVS